jgi:hypothetical protein
MEYRVLQGRVFKEFKGAKEIKVSLDLQGVRVFKDSLEYRGFKDCKGSKDLLESRV